LTAQTLVVQTITSSVVYSSGSNIFGNAIANTQTFTGSVLVTGSLTISTGGNASAPTIFGSTIACSPIGCFATSCATSFIGGTLSGTTIYGSTAVCSPVGKFTSCIDAGSGTFACSLSVQSTTASTSTSTGALIVCGGIGVGDNSYFNGLVYLKRNNQTLSLTPNTGTSSTFIDAQNTTGRMNIGVEGSSGGSMMTGTSAYSIGLTAISANDLYLGTSGVWGLKIAATGQAATFSSTITGTTIYGSTAVCSPVGKFTSCIDAGSATFSGQLNVCYASFPEQRITDGTIGYQMYSSTGASDFVVGTYTNHNLIFRTNQVTRLSITCGGIIGINTDNLTSPGLTGNTLFIRACSGNVGQSAIAIQDYRKCTRWVINGQDGCDNFNFSIYSTPCNNNDYSRRFNINQGGNIGIGVTPCTWANAFTALQVGTAALTTNVNAYGYFSANFYNDADGVDRYISSGKAGVISISNGEIIFYNTDASCAAGCVLTSSERMRITSVGNVGVGISAPTAILHLSSCVAGASNSLFIQNSCTTGTGAKIIFAPNSNFGVNDNAAAISSCSTAGGYDVDLVFTTYKSAVGPIERMRIAGGTGAVTRQCQPYFYADTLTAGSLAGNCTVIWGNLRASQNTGYNTTNGVFTAPVTGVYTFSWAYLYCNITNSAGCIDDGFSLNGTQIYSGNRFRICQRSWGDQYVAVQGSAILRLAANDYFKVITSNSGDSGLAAYGGSTWGYLTGALI
jgi:hypothetical protein